MTARAAIRKDDFKRLVQATIDCGISIQRIDFDGQRVSIIPGDPDAAPPFPGKNEWDAVLS